MKSESTVLWAMMFLVGNKTVSQLAVKEIKERNRFGKVAKERQLHKILEEVCQFRCTNSAISILKFPFQCFLFLSVKRSLANLFVSYRIFPQPFHCLPRSGSPYYFFYFVFLFIKLYLLQNNVIIISLRLDGSGFLPKREQMRP